MKPSVNAIASMEFQATLSVKRQAYLSAARNARRAYTVWKSCRRLGSAKSEQAAYDMAVDEAKEADAAWLEELRKAHEPPSSARATAGFRHGRGKGFDKSNTRRRGSNETVTKARKGERPKPQPRSQRSGIPLSVSTAKSGRHGKRKREASRSRTTYSAAKLPRTSSAVPGPFVPHAWPATKTPDNTTLSSSSTSSDATDSFVPDWIGLPEEDTVLFARERIMLVVDDARAVKGGSLSDALTELHDIAKQLKGAAEFRSARLLLFRDTVKEAILNLCQDLPTGKLWRYNLFKLERDIMHM